MTNTDDGGKRISSVERSFAVIEELHGADPMRIDDVADRLDMPRSTAHVHLKTLESVGYVVRDQDGYRLGLRFLRNGVTVREQVGLYDQARTNVDELAEETGEVASLGVEEGKQRVILYQAEGTNAVYDNAPIGEYTEMHWTALGKAILAERPSEFVERYLNEFGLPKGTENTITDRDRFRTELEETRNREFALEDEERRKGIRSVAAPIIVDSEAVGAISLSGPRERFDDERIHDDLVPILKDMSNIIEVKCAYE